MPTQIIDGFRLNAMTPIDSRMVTSGTVSRNNLAYKYEGLRVFDTTQKVPFVYIDGQWKEELAQSSQASAGGVIGSTGKNNYISKFSSQGLTNSVIRETSGGANTWIGINIPISSPVEAQLHVGGVVKASSFCGNLNGTFVLPQTMPLNRMQYPSDTTKEWLLKFQGGTPVWGSSNTSAASANVDNDTNSSNSFITFVNGTNGSQTLKVSCRSNTQAFSADLSTSQVLLSQANGSDLPPYSFIGSPGTGLYGNSAEAGISVAGNKRISILSNRVEISSGGTVNIDAGTTYIELKKNTTVSGTVNISGVTTVNNTIVAQNIELSQGFKLTKSGFGLNKVLMSDVAGNGSWQSAVSLGVPVGTIIMFMMGMNNLPTGWKPCTFYSNTSGTLTGSTYKGQIYINGGYVDIPDLRDRNVAGSTDMESLTAFGDKSPINKQTTTLTVSNLPYHKHGVCTQLYSGQSLATTALSQTLVLYDDDTSHSHSYSCTPDGNCRADPENDQDTRNVGYEATATTGAAGKHTHRKLDQNGNVVACSYIALTGYTDDGSNFHGQGALGKAFDNPHYKTQTLVFIVKIDPDATAGTVGHFKIVSV